MGGCLSVEIEETKTSQTAESRKAEARKANGQAPTPSGTSELKGKKDSGTHSTGAPKSSSKSSSRNSSTGSARSSSKSSGAPKSGGSARSSSGTKKEKPDVLPANENNGPPEPPARLDNYGGIPPAKRYKLKDLQVATNNFDETQVLGEGSFGKVYKGVLDDVRVAGQGPGVVQRMDVAVKKLNHSSFQGYDEWLSEVLLLEKLRHPNLVRLVGYCAEGDEALLAYELCPKGSLDNAFFTDDEEKIFTWEQRIKVALDAAEGLNFLHEHNVIHRDYKPANILLMDDMSARLTDFGMSKEGPEGADQHISTRIMGTLGYLDPAYMQTGRLTRKSDVYSFGVMILELITGRRSQEENLTKWARPLLAGRKPDIQQLIDPRLEDRYSRNAAVKLAILAKHCLDDDPVSRPEMRILVDSLKRILKDV